MTWKGNRVRNSTKVRFGVWHGGMYSLSFHRWNLLRSRLRSALGLVSKGRRCEHKLSLPRPQVGDNLFLCHMNLSGTPAHPLPSPSGFYPMLLLSRFQQSRGVFPSKVLYHMACLYHRTHLSLVPSIEQEPLEGVDHSFTEILFGSCSLVHTDTTGNVLEVKYQELSEQRRQLS